ncbi:DUF2786 domain-containing protein [Rhodoferax aquaticus]|uniref:DUF2786 domain-containing protein n=1 Tax=Rhodoferax aquaticus TaxID=2527691 RepID=A0A515ETC4_9BURK|nr:DUF2786 domain-containing protein [Rhodoferax aquaticus]QDL55924.1 DUF2786 domain-containing protein [Rhodoferax aquaticus]
MNREQALSKIKKCLALAKSSNPHEAAAAMRQAQKLMAEHNLTETDVSLADVMEASAPARLNSITPWETTLAYMIAEAFGCDHLSKSSRHLTRSRDLIRKRDYVFVGIGAAPQVAGYAYDVLSRQCARDRLTHIRKQPKNCKPITKTARGDEFALGWVYGVRSLVEGFAGTERNQHLIEQYMAEHYPDLASAKVKDRAKGRNVSHNDSWEGRQAGKRAQLNRAVGGLDQRGLLA